MLSGYKYLIIVSLILASGFLNLILGGLCYRYYKKYIAQRLDPSGISIFHTELNSIPSGCLHKVMIIGSSRAAQWPAVNIENTCFINAGIHGQTSSQVRLRIESQLKRIKPEIIILQVGTNDVKAISLFPFKTQLIYNQYKDNLYYFLQMCKNLDTKVIITTIFPVPNVPLIRRLFWTEESTNAIDKFNHFLLTLNTPESAYVFDAHNLLIDPETNQLSKIYRKDFLHLNDKGYAKLNGELEVFIRKILYKK